ncbi:conserved hypothetical protein [Paenibacillus curdlanolyticus YK9]|uniref:DUF559 domain-containing protein n=1 Tax=Paenibacillus curdlanolyticus YK9 TaxID=717606 RepID=E0IDH4_9BACL|nr:hypothetical protein [Paenibacillus curdlanolyticus]EFM09629.1 conserved hypothetical protein [Paenibacillus curdlanolyticus YK9]
MDFEQAYGQFLEHHTTSRADERRGRLVRGHQYAEKLLLQQVWWPLFGTLEHLHPEYEIYDWNRKSQFLDFAFLPAYGKFGIECDGFQSHVKDMDREKFSYSLNRDTFLTGMGWKMLHFSFDDIQNRPEVCRLLLQLAIGPYLLRNAPVRPESMVEKDILRLAWSLARPIRPKDVIERFGVNFRTARNWLRALTDKGLLRPIENRTNHVRAYALKAEPKELLL